MGVTASTGRIDSVVHDKLETSGDDPPIIFARDGNLFSVRLDGAAPVPLTNTGFNSNPYYLPQEGKLIFIRGKSPSEEAGDVVNIDFQTGRQTVLLPASAFNQDWVKDLSTGAEKEKAGTEGAEPLQFT